MGFGTTFAMLTFLFIFAGMTVMVITVQKNLATTTTEIKEQQQKTATAQEQEISITSTSYTYAEITNWKTTYKKEFEKGNYTNTTSNTDSIELKEPETTGTYTSEAYNTGHTSNYTSINWNAALPGGTTLTFQLRTANTTTDLELTPYTGPDGTTNTHYTNTGQQINETHDNNQYIQYQATLTTIAAGTTPTLYDVTIPVRRGVGHAKIQVTNTGKTKLDFTETDAYIDGVRVLREQSDRLLEWETTIDTHLWNPGEELNITIFTNIPASATATITNEYAKDSTTVTP